MPLNPYHLAVTAVELAPYAEDLVARYMPEIYWRTHLSFAVIIDRALFDKNPLDSQSPSDSSLVTVTIPGLAANSNGLFRVLGDHAENSFSVDGQPIRDEQSKVF